MTDTPKHPTDCTCAGPDEHTPGCGVHHEQHVDVFQRLAACASTWMPSACVFGNVRADEIAAACEWAIDRATHRAAVVADSPELAQARADASRRLAERDAERAIIDGLRAALGLKPGVGLGLAALTAVARDKLSEDDMESADAVDGLVRESLDLRALAEDELAQARERIAALEAVTVGYRVDLAALEIRHSRMVDAGVELGAVLTEALQRGDAALARVRELEARALVLRDHAEDVRRDAVQLLDTKDPTKEHDE